MISAIVDAAGGSLAPTLAALVPAAADGLVREVIVADAAGSLLVAEVAEDAGAKRIAGGAASFTQACAAARQDWLLLLRAGTRLESGWGAAAWRHINDHADQAGWFQLSLRGNWPGAVVEEAWGALAGTWFGRLRAEHPVLVPRRFIDEAADRGVAVELPLKLARGRLRPIPARALADLGRRRKAD